MRYHRVRVRNFRGIAEAEVAFPEGRLLVIEGPNEAGKSSIVEAIRLLFDYTAESNAEEVRAVRPAGRDVDPEVELEFALGGSTYRYRKVFGRRGVTELEERGAGGTMRTGREAHDEAKRLLESQVDTALLTALRVMQGESLAMAGDLARSASLLRALDAGAGADPAVEGLFERARKERERYYTAARELETGELRAARDAQRSAAAEVERLEGRLRKLEETARLVEALEPEAAHLRQAIGELARRSEELAEQREAYRAAKQAAEIAERDAAAARERQARLEEEAARREKARRDEEQLTRELQAARAREEEARLAAEAARGALDAARQAAESARGRVERLERNAVQAANDYAHLQEELQLALMRERLAEFDKQAKRLDEAKAYLKGCRIDERALGAVEEAAKALARTDAQLRAVTAKVAVDGPAGARVAVDGREETLADGPLELEAAEELRVELPGGFAVIVRPSQSQGLLERRLAEQRETLAALLRDCGASSVEEARELEQRRRKAEGTVAEAEPAMRRALRDLRDRADLEGRLERTRQRVEAYRAEQAGRPLPATPEEARKVKETGEGELDDARTAARQAEEALRRAQEAAGQAVQEASAASVQVASLERQLAQLREQLGREEARRPTAALDADLAAARGEAALAAERLAAAEQQLGRLAGAAGEAMEVERQLEAARAQLRDIEDRVAEARGALRHEGEGTLQAELDAARTRLEAAEVHLERLERRARAARLLYEMLTKHREAARQAYGPLLAGRLQELGRRVFGEDFAVELDGGLAPARRRLQGTWLEVRQLSVGAREQLAVLHRAACAAAAGEGGVPFFLDDALGWSDETRLREMARVLEELAREVQVVVLTCQPGRFAGAQEAAVVRVAAGRTGEGSEGAGGQGRLFGAG